MDGRKAVVLANKQDIPGCMTTAEVTEKIGDINRKRKPEWQLPVFPTSAKTGEGFLEVCEWLYKEMSRDIENEVKTENLEEKSENLEKTEKSEKYGLGFVGKVMEKIKRLLIE